MDPKQIVDLDVVGSNPITRPNPSFKIRSKALAAEWGTRGASEMRHPTGERTRMPRGEGVRNGKRRL